MGKYDEAIYNYLSDNDRFADLFNAVFFDGKQVLKGEMLESDSERHVVVQPKNAAESLEANNEVKSKRNTGTPSKSEAEAPLKRNTIKLPVTESRFRDIKKRAKTGESFVVTAIENQDVIDYTMPWRIMQYDQMEYGEQIRRIRRRKAAVLRTQGKKPNDWQTRLEPMDRLRPIYTICFYHGTESWDGPRSLEDMMAFEATDNGELWRQCFHNYGMTLFCAGEVVNPALFGTDLRQLLEVLALRKDKQGLAELWSREDFTHLDRETAETIAIMTDSTEILEKLDYYETAEGGYNMCLAVDEMRREWKEEGKSEGRTAEMENGIACLVKAIRQLGGTMDAAAQQLIAQYGLDESTASGKARLYW